MRRSLWKRGFLKRYHYLIGAFETLYLSSKFLFCVIGAFLMSTPRLAVGYTRVSLEDENIENQVYEVQRFAEQNNITLVGIFKDIGVSGAKPTMEREGFKQMLNVLESLPAVRTIIVLDLTRLVGT
jgi:Site-specific recombinases, DNA invertase Pin homologs